MIDQAAVPPVSQLTSPVIERYQSFDRKIKFLLPTQQQLYSDDDDNSVDEQLSVEH